MIMYFSEILSWPETGAVLDEIIKSRITLSKVINLFYKYLSSALSLPCSLSYVFVILQTLSCVF